MVDKFIKRYDISCDNVFFYAKEFQDYGSFAIYFGLFNKSGQYLEIPNCTEEKLLNAISNIITFGEEQFIKDTLIETYYLIPDSMSTFYENKVNNYEIINHDSLDLVKSTRLIPINLEKYLSNVRDKIGNKPNIDLNSIDYVIVKEFVIGGKPSYNALIINSLIKEIKKIEREYNIKIYLALVNLDIRI
jgi:hypothetical protein